MDRVQDIVKGLADNNITDEDGDNEQEEPEESGIDKIFSDNEQKIHTQIDDKVIKVVKMVKELGKEMKKDASQQLEERKKGINSTVDIKNPEYLGISFEEAKTTNKRIKGLFGTILPCAGKITQEQRAEFNKLPEQIVQDFNCEDLTENVSQLSSTKETHKGFSWQIEVMKHNKFLCFRPVITNLRPEEDLEPEEDLIIHFRIYLIWDNEPQSYLQMVHTMTENKPKYKKLLDWKKLPDHTDQFKIRCIMQIVDEKLTFPHGGKELTEEEKNDYNLTVIPIQIDAGFCCKWFNEHTNNVIKLIPSNTDLGFSLGFEVKRSSKFLRVKPFTSDKEDSLKPIIHFKFYLIWKDEPQYYLEMERTNPAFENLIFWDELNANTNPFKIRCVLLNADERVKLTPKK